MTIKPEDHIDEEEVLLDDEWKHYGKDYWNYRSKEK